MQKAVTSCQWVKRAARAAAMGIVAAAAAPAVLADGFGINIRIGEPPPRREVIVREEPVVYETYVVGYRRNLYDADLRLRVARAEEWNASEDLEAARGREGEIAVRLDDAEAACAELRQRVGGRAALVAELHEKVTGTSVSCEDLRRRLDAYGHRIAAAREDLTASKLLNDSAGVADATDRIRINEARAAAAANDLRDAEGRLGRFREEEAALSGIAADRERLRDLEASLGDVRHDFEVSHDGVYNCQQRLTTAHEEVCAALHDRDEALWLLHRDEILAGRFEPERCGFHIDLSVWGGRMPRDPEVIHRYCVRDAGYYRENPVIIEERVVIAERAPEIVHIHKIQRVREVEKIQVVERVETRVKPEDRHRVAEHVVVERQRFQAEATERKTAAAEHRPPKPVFVERPRDAKLKEQVKHANARAREDEQKLAQQQKQIDANRREDRRQEEEIAKLKADQQKLEHKQDKAAERQQEKLEKQEKLAERKQEKQAEKQEKQADRNDKNAGARNAGNSAADTRSARADSKDSKKGKGDKDGKGDRNGKGDNDRDKDKDKDGQASVDDLPRR
jgi:hypothetical protein